LSQATFPKTAQDYSASDSSPSPFAYHCTLSLYS
jgi:hypothetical protein